MDCSRSRPRHFKFQDADFLNNLDHSGAHVPCASTKLGTQEKARRVTLNAGCARDHSCFTHSSRLECCSCLRFDKSKFLGHLQSEILSDRVRLLNAFQRG